MKKASVVKLSGLIAWKVVIAKKAVKVNWDCRVALRRLELVDAAPDPVVKKRRIRKYSYCKCRKDEFGKELVD